MFKNKNSKYYIMKQLFVLTVMTLLVSNIFGQNEKLNELISQGVAFHDQGKYEDAIMKYKQALEIDKNSTLANYELSYTYFSSGKYEEAIKYSTNVIKQNSDNLHPAYIILGSSLDLTGKAKDAIKIYEEGVKKFPDSYLLYYNIALTCYNQKEYDKAEKAAINAITIKPTHGSSHLILSVIMRDKGQRVKSILAMYYFLLLEPNSNRSLINYNSLKKQLGQGVERKDEKNINVSIPFSSKSDDFGAAEMTISLLEASKYTEENKNKTEMEIFIENNKSIFAILAELKKENKGFWWDFYVTKFYDLKQSDNYEAFSYYISQSTNNDIIKKWITENPAKMNTLTNWIKKVNAMP